MAFTGGHFVAFSGGHFDAFTLAVVCFQAEVKPQTDGCNGLKYNLTADIIHSIFRTYPAGTKLNFT